MARLRRHVLWFLLSLVVIILFRYNTRTGEGQRAERIDSRLSSPADHEITPHLVVAGMLGDDTSWIRRRLPTWSSSIYIANSQSASLTVPMNKGREGMVYLTYLIEHYDSLPEIIYFIHALQYQWHNDDINHDSATLISRVQTQYVLEEGYVNLRCVWHIGCPNQIHPFTPVQERPAEARFREAFIQLFPGQTVPKVVAAACCAQFALSRQKVLELPRSEYERLRSWLINTPLDDDTSGRIMEYSWHMLFGKPAVHCPGAKSCYCKVFGICDTVCTIDHCDGLYEQPKYSRQPDTWRELPEYRREL